MTDSLFDMAAVESTPPLSPWDAWEKLHGIRTQHFPEITSENEHGAYPWCAYTGDCDPTDEMQFGEGDTRDEAIADLCRKRNIPPMTVGKMKGE